MVLPRVLTCYCVLLPKWVHNPRFGIMVYMYESAVGPMLGLIALVPLAFECEPED